MRIMTVVVPLLLLCACSGGETPAPAPKQGTVSEGNVFKGDVDALAKAKQADKTIQDAAEQQRAAVDAQQ